MLLMRTRLILCLILLLIVLTGCARSPSPLPTEVATDATAAATSSPLPEEEDTVPTRSYAGKIPAPEFPPNLDWLNTGRPLTLAQLKGKVVLLDFWTYGCVNCMHIIPDLKKLEAKYANELVVIGVHSAKFSNEAETDNIRRVILRYELAHPVVNDDEFAVWQLYGATAWPTLVLIDPEGKVIGSHAGEGGFDLFDEVIGSVVAAFDARGLLDRTPLPLILERENQADSPLRFPGKVLADAAGNRLFIADSNHNRIVVTDLTGTVLAVIGGGVAGLRDGDYRTARFFRPQGLALADENTLYVADTENHAIRRVDLGTGLVRTVAGTGEQAYMTMERGPALGTALNSPWDVLYARDRLYIAMAGQHQVWVYDPGAEEVFRYAGTGREELKDGPRLTGGLNQPSGLASDGLNLYIADSEASAIRTAGLTADGRLGTVVGVGLFDFGDVDGVGDKVRLQHPLGVAFQDDRLYVADTYNSKIKVINPKKRESLTLFGGEGGGWRDGAQPLFDEPGGISVAGNLLYIADTNNHVIRVANLKEKTVSTLVLVDNDGLLTRAATTDAPTGKIVALDEQTVAPGAGVVQLDVTLPAGYKLNDLAPFSMSWRSADAAVTFAAAASDQRIVHPDFPLSLPATFQPGETTLTADIVVYYCTAATEQLCLIEQVRLLLPVTVRADAPAAPLTVAYTVPHPAPGP